MFSISIAIVIGPTPPGTGVIKDTFSYTEVKSTSPKRPAFVRLIPTSTTIAPCFTNEPSIKLGFPTADTIISSKFFKIFGITVSHCNSSISLLKNK